MNITIRFPFELTIDIRAYLVLFRMEFRLKRWLIHIYIFFFIQSRPWRTRSIYLKVNKISVQFIAISKVCPFMHGIYLFTSVCIHHIYQYFRLAGNKDPPPRNRFSKIISPELFTFLEDGTKWQISFFWKKKKKCGEVCNYIKK